MRRIGVVLLVLLVLLVGLWIYLDSSLNREPALADYDGRPAAGAGTNWLIVGSDSREELTEEDRDQLGTGNAKGRRTDTIMLLHIPSGDQGATLVSLPRDSFVTVPGKGKRKLNAAFSLGGAPLLTRTVEEATGLRLNHYAEVGFGGFAAIVDAIGGVQMCLDQPLQDPKANIDLPSGCQELNGGDALGFVRTRIGPRADLDRVIRQRQFLSVLITKATSMEVLLNPFRSVPLMFDVPAAFLVDNGDHLHHLVGLALAMRGAAGGALVTTTVPIGGFANVPGQGSVVQWNKEKAVRLFDSLEADRAVPEDVITKVN
jgi:LCP family protein required for cell wall assembly